MARGIMGRMIGNGSSLGRSEFAAYTASTSAKKILAPFLAQY